MRQSIDIRVTALLAAAGILFCLVLSVASPSTAKAALSSYCGNQTKWGYETCWGEPRTLYAVYGWGDHHSACVGTSAYTNTVCSGGPGQGVYAPVGYTAWLYPWIQNNAGGTNRLHGVAYQP